MITYLVEDLPERSAAFLARYVNLPSAGDQAALHIHIVADKAIVPDRSHAARV